MTIFKKSLQDQSITLKDTLVYDNKPIPLDNEDHKIRWAVLMTLGVIALVWGAFIAGMLVRSTIFTNKPNNILTCSTDKCHSRKASFINYFIRNKVKSPEAMAEAVLSTRNPRLLAAIHVAGEKKTPHTAMKTGYKNRYSGAWQTADNWGKVTKHTSITEQALIAELAIETHTFEEKHIIRGLNTYGGESDKVNGKYAYNVLTELGNVPK